MKEEVSLFERQSSVGTIRAVPRVLAICLCQIALSGMAHLDASPIPEQKGYKQGSLIYSLEERPTPQCHASTLVEGDQGLVAAWFGGTREKHPDVGIWVSRRIEGQWTTPTEVANGIQSPSNDDSPERYPCWNPVLFRPRNGPLMLFFKVGPTPQQWWGEVMISEDEGRTWKDRRRLPDGGIGPVKNKPIQLANGTILCGSSTEHEGWRVHFEMTSDLGKTWSHTQPINDGVAISAIQPSILTHPGGRLQALGRSRQGRMWQAWSTDLGKTWSKMTLMDLPNPNAGTDAVTLQDKRQLLVYNHTPKGRSPLNVAISSDGKKWNEVLALEDQPGEYSYPAVIQTSDGLVHVTYTWKRRSIKHVVIDPKALAR
jgi:predicted neuraminidase